MIAVSEEQFLAEAEKQEWENRRLERWVALWQRQGIVSVVSKPKYRYLVRRYNEKHRAYHTLTHIDFGLETLDEYQSLAGDRDAIEIAWWYHDVIYNPHRRDNEDKSKVYVHKAWTDALAPKQWSTVDGLIDATKHNTLLADTDQQLIADIDLLGFARAQDLVVEACRDVRREYEHVPLEDFVKGHRAILRSFLQRAHVFYRKEMRDRYEELARRNIAHIIEQLPKIVRQR